MLRELFETTQPTPRFGGAGNISDSSRVCLYFSDETPEAIIFENIRKIFKAKCELS